MAEEAVPRWMYAVGAAGIFAVLFLAPSLVDTASKPVSDHIVDGIEDMQSSTSSTSTSTTTIP